jgi:hypothetical protein
MKSQWRRQSDDGLLNNWAEGFKIINAFLLGKTYSNEACFIMLNAAISTMLDPIYLSAANNIHRRMKGN